MNKIATTKLKKQALANVKAYVKRLSVVEVGFENVRDANKIKMQRVQKSTSSEVLQYRHPQSNLVW